MFSNQQCSIRIVLQKALESVGFSAEDIINIFRIVAAVLKLGNLIFSPVSNIDGTDGCSINNEYGIWK